MTWFRVHGLFRVTAFSIYNRKRWSWTPRILILSPVVNARMGLQRSEKIMSQRDWEVWKMEELELEKQTYCGDWAWRNQHRRLVQIGEWPLTITMRSLPQVFFFKLKVKKQSCLQIGKLSLQIAASACPWMPSLKKQWKSSQTRKYELYHLTAARVPHHTHLLCFISRCYNCRLYFWNRLPDYFASAEKFISRLPSKFMYSYVVLVVSGYWTSCPDTGQRRSTAKILISLWKQRQKS